MSFVCARFRCRRTGGTRVQRSPSRSPSPEKRRCWHCLSLTCVSSTDDLAWVSNALERNREQHTDSCTRMFSLWNSFLLRNSRSAPLWVLHLRITEQFLCKGRHFNSWDVVRADILCLNSRGSDNIVVVVLLYDISFHILSSFGFKIIFLHFLLVRIITKVNPLSLLHIISCFSCFSLVTKTPIFLLSSQKNWQRTNFNLKFWDFNINSNVRNKLSEPVLLLLLTKN